MLLWYWDSISLFLFCLWIFSVFLALSFAVLDLLWSSVFCSRVGIHLAMSWRWGTNRKGSLIMHIISILRTPLWLLYFTTPCWKHSSSIGSTVGSIVLESRVFRPRPIEKYDSRWSSMFVSVPIFIVFKITSIGLDLLLVFGYIFSLFTERMTFYPSFFLSKLLLWFFFSCSFRDAFLYHRSKTWVWIWLIAINLWQYCTCGLLWEFQLICFTCAF